MAHKTNKQIDKYQEDKQRFQWECLRRGPDFISDVKKFWKPVQKEPIKVLDLEKQFFEKYGIFPPEEKLLKNSECWDAMDGYDIVSVVMDRHWTKFMLGKTIAEKLINWRKLLKNKRVELYKYILKNDRFLSLRIDTDRDKTIIMRAISKKLDWIIENKRKFKLGNNYDKTVHLDKFKRYFAVWDLVQKRKQLWPFERIAQKLKEEGWYNKQTLKQATVLARQDYRTACKAIGIPVKEKKNTLKKVMKPIISSKIKGAKAQKDLFEEWEGKLADHNLGLDEYIPKKSEDKGIDSFRHNPTDGPTKQKLRSVQKIETNVAKRLNGKRKEYLRKLIK